MTSTLFVTIMFLFQIFSLVLQLSTVSTLPLMETPVEVSYCVKEHNQERTKHGLSPLSFDKRNSSLAHAKTMMAQNCFAVQCKDEQSPFERMRVAGYDWFRAGENIAAGMSTCKDAVTSWMRNNGTRRQILGDFVDMGCAMASCKTGCDYNFYFTCDFASPWTQGSLHKEQNDCLVKEEKEGKSPLVF